MRESFIHPPLRFFASANGSDGFRSYFDEIFSSDQMDGVFILKGGPGTGKSTLLSELAKAFDQPHIEKEIFYCSSDPRSLDGLLLKHKEKSVCVLDGTAPHERDAYLPGACDALVDLGACFNTAQLRAEKANILPLLRQKKLAYKEAYFYLGLFGIFENKIEAELRKRIKTEEIRHFTKEIVAPLICPKNDAVFSPRLIRAFSRDGIVLMDTFEKAAERHIVFSGEEIAASLVLSEIFSALRTMGCGGYFAPSPFSKDRIDGIFLTDEKISVTAKNTQEGECCERFFSSPDKEEQERLRTYRAEADRFLSLSKESLMRASENHFALEKIYTPAVDFAKMQPLKDRLKQQIAQNLGLAEIS